MKILNAAAIAAIALGTVAGFGGAAAAKGPALHVMNVALPGGGIEQIFYTGDTPPRVSIQSAPAAFAGLGVLPSPFAELDRISAMMDRQAAAMLQQAAALTAAPAFTPGPLTATEFRGLPAGSQGYSFTSMLTGNGVCTRSLEITSTGNGAPPKVVTHSSGSCEPQGGATGTIGLPPVEQPQRRSDMVMTSAQSPRHYAGLVRDATWRH